LAPHGIANFNVAASQSYMAARAAHLDSVTESQFDAMPALPLDDILQLVGGPRPSIRLTISKTEDGPLPWNEALALLSLLVVKNPKEVLEISTYMGHTAKAMAENLSGAIIHTVDLPPNHAFEGDGEAKIDKADLHLIAKRIVGREFLRSPVFFSDPATLS
jgi:hypothetical protein